jgi:tetratricopeptide (TPR) repeat protein
MIRATGIGTLLLLAASVASGEPRDDADRAVRDGRASPRQLAFVGLSRWNEGRSPEESADLFRKALKANPAEPYARLGLLLFAQRALSDGEELDQALEILRQTPSHPAARLASLSVLRLAGSSIHLDDRILQGLTELCGGAHASCTSLGPKGRAQRLKGPWSGEVRYRLLEARSRIEANRGDYDAAQLTRDQAGLLTSFELVGPLSPFHWLEFDRPLGPELDASAASFSAPWGPEAWRSIRFSNGQIPVGHAIEERSPGAEEGRQPPPSGDVLYGAARVRAGRAGLRFRVDSSASVALFVDGRGVLTRDRFRRILPRASWIQVAASPGVHRLLVKAAAGDSTAGFRVFAQPWDDSDESTPSLDPAALAAELSTEVGLRIGQVLAAHDGQAEDPARALSLVADLAGRTPGLLELSERADLLSQLGTLGEEEVKGRMQRDLDLLIARDPKSASGRLRRAGLALEQGRSEDASADLDALFPSARAEVAKARLRLSREATALAQAPLEAALKLDPGFCPALELEIELLEQEHAFGSIDATAETYAQCPGGQAAAVQIRAQRQGPSPLLRYWRSRLERSPADFRAAAELAEAQLAADRPQSAARVIEQWLHAWPEDYRGLRDLGQAWALAGDLDRARAAWERALALDPSALELRRSLLLLSNQDVLDGALPDAASALHAPLWTGVPRAPTATRLDSGAVWVHRDASTTERVRTVERILDEKGLTEAGELQIPLGAQLIALRTHKPDGRILESPALSGGEKRSISANGLAVGDDLEIDYLLASPPPSRGLGGSADPFFFQATDSSLQRSIYRIQSERPLIADAHRFELPEGAAQSLPGALTLERTHVNALIEEPAAPPTAEFLPWVEVGFGATASDLARELGDQLASRVSADEGVRRLATAAGRAPRISARVESLWRAVSAAIRGDGGSLAEPASATIARGAGDRLLPMRAALEYLGIPSHLVVASSPLSSAEPRRFLRLADYTVALLRIEPKGEAPMWLEPSLRSAPLGRLPPALCGQPAIELPNGAEAGRAFILPDCHESAQGPPGPDDHALEIELSIAADGSVRGEGSEIFRGYDAAAVNASLEQIDDDQRRQTVESALSAAFRGATLEALEFDLGSEPGAPARVHYRFTAPDFARVETGNRWSAPIRAFPVRMAERYLQLAARTLPLLIGGGERPTLMLTLHLPPGAQSSQAAPASISLDTPFGSYVRTEERAPGLVRLRERLVLPAQRVLPARYASFGSFASQVDAAQSERVDYALGGDSL